MAAARYLASLSRENCIDAAFRTWDASSGALPGHMRRVSTSQPTTVTSLRAAAIAPNNSPALAEVEARPSARGKFMFVGDDKLYVRGVTYGTFRPDADGHEYPPLDIVKLDFSHMAACGGNAARVYTVPPPWLLDSAWRHGLRAMVGLPVERYVGLLADRTGALDHQVERCSEAMNGKRT